MKKLTLFTLLILMTTACAKKNAGVDENEDFGLGGDPVMEGEIVLPEETPPGGSTIPEDDDTEEEAPVVCEPVDITTTAFNEETLAGEDYYLDITTRNPCIYYACELASGPDWLTMNGCRLEGTPNTAESLGVHENIQVRVYDSTDNTNADVLGFTLTVYDEPEIVPYRAHACTPAKGEKKGKNEKKGEILKKGAESFEITLGRAELCLRVDGYADEYDVDLSGHENLSAERINGKLFQVTGLENASQNEAIVITAEADGEFVYEPAYAEFDLTIHPNPCDTPLTVRKTEGILLENNGNEISNVGLGPDQVLLGKKYRAIFEVTGGEAPYDWEYESTVTTDVQTPDCGENEGFGTWMGLCGENFLTTNTNWKPVRSDDEDEHTGSSYFQLEAVFSFPDKDLPYDLNFTNRIFDALTVTVRSKMCEAEVGPNFQTAETTVPLEMIPPNETLGDARCRIDVGSVSDSNSSEDMHSSMGIIFQKREGEERIAVGGIEYNATLCNNSDHCSETKSIAFDNLQNSSLEHNQDITLLFIDKIIQTSNPFSSDHDDLDFHLQSISCETPFRSFHLNVTGQFGGNIMGYRRSWGAWFGDLVGSVTSGPLGGLLGLAWDGADYSSWATLGSNTGQFYRCLTGGNCSWWPKTHTLAPPLYLDALSEKQTIWQPRPRPDYSSGSTE